MKIIKRKEALEKQNSDKCTVMEYLLNDDDIDCAIATITGRYPVSGYGVNEKCKAMVYVIEGIGSLNTKSEVIDFKKGDVLLIDKGEAYYWDANCKIVMSCTPAWYKEQYKAID